MTATALTVGRLERYKGVQHAIRALPHTDHNLTVVGSGAYRNALEQEAESVGVSDRVRFAGTVTDAELSDHYRRAEVLLALSTHEAFGMTIGEALANGTPAVVRDAKGLTRWTGTAGVVAVGSVEPQAVAEAMQAASRIAPDRRPLPDWAEVADQLEALMRP